MSSAEVSFTLGTACTGRLVTFVPDDFPLIFAWIPSSPCGLARLTACGQSPRTGDCSMIGLGAHRFSNLRSSTGGDRVKGTTQ